MEYTAKHGVTLESKYPYVDSVQMCKWHRKMPVVKNRGIRVIEPGDEEALKYAVAKHGPVTVAIPGYEPSFRFYESGMFAVHY